MSRRRRVILEGPPERAWLWPSGNSPWRREEETTHHRGPGKKTVSAERRCWGLRELIGGESDFQLEQGWTPSGMRWLFHGNLSHERGAE